MKYPNINALVPDGEHFDESGINGEGGWITTSHISAIENALSENENALKTANDSLSAAVQQQQDSDDNLRSVTEELDAAKKTIGERDATIAELNKTVEEFGRQPSGNGSSVKMGGEEMEATEERLPRFDSAEHPGNVAASRFVRKKK